MTRVYVWPVSHQGILSAGDSVPPYGKLTWVEGQEFKRGCYQKYTVRNITSHLYSESSITVQCQRRYTTAASLNSADIDKCNQDIKIM